MSPHGDWGVRVLVWDTPGFGHHRFGGRCLFFSRFWGCTRTVSVVVKRCFQSELSGVFNLESDQVLLEDLQSCPFKLCNDVVLCPSSQVTDVQANALTFRESVSFRTSDQVPYFVEKGAYSLV